MSTNLNSKQACPFCDTSQKFRYISDGKSARAIYPKNPACAFHVLLVPKRHVETYDQLKPNEVKDINSLILLLVNSARLNLDASFVGFQFLSNNGGPAVNQHVQHCHVHLFLRTDKDTSDPIKGNDTAGTYSLTEKDIANMEKVKNWLKRFN